MRQTSGSLVCPGCGKLIDIDEKACPNCRRWQPGLFGFGPALTRALGSLEVTGLIASACIGLYIIGLALDPRSALGGGGGGLLGFLSPGTRALYQLGMTGGWAWETGHWYTIFSATFLHGGLLHIFFNVMWIRQLGPLIEDAFGPVRFFVIFILAGAGGFLVSNVASGLGPGPSAPTVGASGSIFGLLAAAIVYGRKQGNAAVIQQFLMWAGLLFVMGFVMSRVNNWAHGGGFVVGYVVAWLMSRSAETQEGPGLQLSALGLAAVTVIAVVLSAITVTSILLRQA